MTSMTSMTSPTLHNLGPKRETPFNRSLDLISDVDFLGPISLRDIFETSRSTGFFLLPRLRYLSDSLTSSAQDFPLSRAAIRLLFKKFLRKVVNS